MFKKDRRIIIKVFFAGAGIVIVFMFVFWLLGGLSHLLYSAFLAGWKFE